MDRYDNLDKALCRELEALNSKYTGSAGEMTEQDVQKADMLYHALKSAETFYAMRDAGDDDDYSGDYMRRRRSYARGRSPVTGRYISRDMGYSGRYPMEYIDPGWDRGY